MRLRAFSVPAPGMHFAVTILYARQCVCVCLCVCASNPLQQGNSSKVLSERTRIIFYTTTQNVHKWERERYKRMQIGHNSGFITNGLIGRRVLLRSKNIIKSHSEYVLRTSELVFIIDIGNGFLFALEVLHSLLAKLFAGQETCRICWQICR